MGKKLLLVLSIFITLTLSGCTKTDDYMQEIFLKHSNLRDPQSAIFRNITTQKSRVWGDIWCGEVKAKNGFGGYGNWLYFQVRVEKNPSILISETPFDQYTDTGKEHQSLNEMNIKLYGDLCFDTKPAPTYVLFR